ncbi:MAG TPA: TonB-dependent receptor [Gemmatimonadaceae bacterium]
MNRAEIRMMRRLVAIALVAFGVPRVVAAQQGTGTISGVITDAASAEPLAGAQVFIASTRQGAMADAQGAYTIADVPAGTVTVRVRMLGYEAIERPITVTAGQETRLDVGLHRTAVTLEAMVVTATGAERTKEIGNSISTLNANEIASASASDPQQILAGRTPGVTVLANSGQPGAGGTIRLRGNNSVSQGNDPIIYIDGVRIFNGHTPTTVGGRQATMPLNDIDPADIDHIEVVKGPAATTLYGTEASGGVIQIFTKHGSDNRPIWSGSIGEGINNMGHVGPSDDPTGLFLNECRGPDLISSDSTRFEDPTCPASGSWLQNGAVQRYSLSVRGGNTTTNYYFSGNYADEAGVIRTGGNKDGGFRGNFSFRPMSGLDFALSSSYTKRKVNWVQDGNNGNGFLLNVSRGPYGNFQGSGCADSTVICVNNAAILTAPSVTNSDHYITGLTVTYNPGEKLNNRLSVGYDYNNALLTTLEPFGFPRADLGQLYWETWNRTLITMDYAGTFKQPFGGSFVSTSSWGGQIFDSRNTASSISASNFSGPGEPTLTSAALRDVTSDVKERVVNAGFFLQQELAWRDRLFVTAGLRVDGNSAFGKSFGLQPYPKLSASYVISDESFWPSSIIETMKLRGAVGESGKAPGAFDAVRTWDPIAAEDGQPAFTPSQLGNPNLGPERTREYEGGFDASALSGRLGVNFTYYKQHTFDALIPMVFPQSQGFLSSQLENVGQIFNNGIELSVDAELVRNPDFDWHARLNYTTINSKAGDLGGQDIVISSVMRTHVTEGYPVPSYFGMKVLNPNAFADPVIDSSAFLGSEYPNKIISPSTSITFLKHFTLDVLGEFQRGGYLLNALGFQNAYKGVWRPCYDVQAKMRAAQAGDASALNDVTALQRMRCTQVSKDHNYDYWVESSDFFRLRNISLTYDLPSHLIGGVRNASLTFAAQNLFTVTDYTGTDPEVNDYRDNSFGRRDYYNFPSYRTFLASLRVTF